MSKRTLIAIALVVMTVSVVGAASYTSATVERDASIGVEADSSAIVQLAPGGVSGVSENADGQLEINLDQNAGLNSEAAFYWGDTNAPTSTYAFEVGNNGGATYQYDLSYSVTGSDEDNGDNVNFMIYDSTGSQVGSAVTENTDQTITVSPTDTYYVVVHVDTAGQTQTADLSGTLTINAAP